MSNIAYSDNHIINSHGISTFGELKYEKNFKHLDYVNPNAPKGGEVSIWAFGSFDSMHPYTPKGRSGSLSSIFFESLLTGTSDEIDSSYGLVAESIEYPKDRSWVIFNMRPEARFSDGSKLTSEDVLFSYELLKEKGLPSFRAVIEKEIEPDRNDHVRQPEPFFYLDHTAPLVVEWVFTQNLDKPCNNTCWGFQNKLLCRT